MEKNDAKTFSFIMSFALTVRLPIGGAIATAHSGLNLGELTDEGDARRAPRGIASALGSQLQIARRPAG
ncbi:MAG: hypothetical protein ACLQU1_36410 [Bryobacteraceae bacterium]